jgi:hypothetical protein
VTRWPDRLRDSQSIPVGGTGKNIEQVFDVQVGLPSTRVPSLPCYTARSPAADLLVRRHKQDALPSIERKNSLCLATSLSDLHLRAMSVSQPKKVYRYQGFSPMTIASLCHDKLYFVNPAEFNDPLDCKPTVESDSDKRTLRAILTELIKRRVAAETLGACPPIWRKCRSPGIGKHFIQRY